jgi:hypothetical protein
VNPSCTAVVQGTFAASRPATGDKPRSLFHKAIDRDLCWGLGDMDGRYACLWLDMDSTIRPFLAESDVGRSLLEMAAQVSDKVFANNLLTRPGFRMFLHPYRY